MGATLSSMQQGIVKTVVERMPMPNDAADEIDLCMPAAIEYCGGEKVLHDADLADCAELPSTSVLEPATALQTRLFGWPDEPLSPTNCVVSRSAWSPQHYASTLNILCPGSDRSPGGKSKRIRLLSTLCSPKRHPASLFVLPTSTNQARRADLRYDDLSALPDIR